MDDLIYRQEAIGALYALSEYNPISVCAIRNSSSAQPERKTATWLIRKWGGDAKCSNCGKTFKDVYDMDNHDRYCRSCGCEMVGIRGESDDSLF